MSKNEIFKLNTIFCGTSDIAVPALDILHGHPKINLLQVITPTSRPAGRGHQLNVPAVAEFAINNKIPLLQTENINNEMAVLKNCFSDQSKSKSKSESKNNLSLDLIIVFAFCQFLKKELLEMPRIGCFNIHASLLPKYRGASPIQHAIWAGDDRTGISIQKMVKRMDAGDVAHFEEIFIHENETGGELSIRLKYLAAVAINNFIDQITHEINSKLAISATSAASLTSLTSLASIVPLTPQDESLASYAKCLYRDDGLIKKGDLTSKSALAIYNQIRAFNPWPGCSCKINGKRLKIIEASIPDKNCIPRELIPAPGKITNNRWLLFGCQDGPIRLSKVQLEGKKVCNDCEFLNGIRGDLKIEE